MSALPLHPQFVHLPLALAMLTPILSLGILIAWWQKWLPRQVWWIATCLHLILSVSAFVAMETGESEEEQVEHVLSHHDIHEHEESAELFFWGTLIISLFSVKGIRAHQNHRGRSWALLSSIVGFAVALLAYETGKQGGELVYHHGAARAYTPVQHETIPHNHPHDQITPATTSDHAPQPSEGN